MKHKRKLIEKFLFFSSFKKASRSQLELNDSGGVAITFDDKSVSEWSSSHEKLRKYNWKATFCVSEIDTLTTDEIEILKDFQNYGHEISGHGYNHVDAVKYVEKYGTEGYLNSEIIPMIESMKEKSLLVKSFAYPYGEHNKKIDIALLKYFKIVRGTCYGRIPPAFHSCYFDYSPIVHGIGIDNQYKHLSEKYLLKLLTYAKERKKILIFYGHGISNTTSKGYHVNPSVLEMISDYVIKHKMKFYTLSDLHDLMAD